MILVIFQDIPTSAAIHHHRARLPQDTEIIVRRELKPLTDAGLPVTLSQTASGITVVYKPVLHKPIDPATGLLAPLATTGGHRRSRSRTRLPECGTPSAPSLQHHIQALSASRTSWQPRPLDSRFYL